ncbi:IS30 family transposase [Shewanella sp. 3_MG-2023]|uniref:IS30 family transposase n=1 Tax=Shewanella sp. 3_MG-2023 TaxID=3062635 RepID=UPI0026E2978A|nr:IS30 family transposase [Shewanella sp. 3_MG-2023]MDO6774598.1 IS30 family transposase [Shewanella sp. 3_MG-2023]
MKQYKQLTLKERYQIETFLNMGFTARKIAIKLTRSNKTISIEIIRCKLGHYNAEVPHRDASALRANATKFTKITQSVIDTVDSSLSIDLSPEQIAGRTKLEKRADSVSMHTIYRLIRTKGWRNRLPRHGKKYRQRKGSEAGAKLIPNRVDIDERPDEVDLKEAIGHWEADTVHATDGYFVSLVERKTKIYLFKRVQRKTKSEVAKAIIKLLKPFKKMCDTITFDNGGEFASHELIAKRLKCKTYFAKPYQSWQRGLNENSNGLLRRYFPKRTSIGDITEQHLADVSLLINMRPRKTLGYLTPLEVLTGKRVSVMSRI